MTPIVGVKAYGWDWSTRHGLTMKEAAQRMVAHGIDWALVQNLIDPLPGSAVEQRPPTGAYDDGAWVATLQDTGRRVYQSTAVFFSPEAFAADPDLRPVDQYGQVFEIFSWYVGVCPTHPAYLERKAERLAQAIRATAPDGVFLSFIRFPGFWEMWLPEVRRSQIREYCFCERCMTTFARETATELPPGGPTAWRRALTGELRGRWTAWKCAYIGSVAQRLRQAALDARPGLDVILNGFGLGTADFDNAVDEVLAQRFADLDAAIDHYELMFYFQILKRDPLEWIPQRVADARRQTSRTLLACLQGDAEYLEPIYADGGRRREITASEWRDALRGVARSGADGILTYSWRDLLADDAAGGSRVATMLEYKRGELA
jgi:hypothetical protein